MSDFLSKNIIPKLPHRENNIDKFTTYLMLNNQNGRLTLQWKYQPYLQRNMKLYEQMNQVFHNTCIQKDNGIGLSLFWLDVVLNDAQDTRLWEPVNKKQLGLEHLAAFLEERCYWAAKTLSTDYNLESWEKCLYTARTLIFNPLKFQDILTRYNPGQTNLNTYVQEALVKHIKCETAQNRFSQWRLLYKKSDKELREALQTIGRMEPNISQFVFARKYFKQIYLMDKIQISGRKLGEKWPAPDEDNFQKAAQCYNAEKLMSSAPHEVAISIDVTASQIKEWMQICIAALNNYPQSILPKFSLEALQNCGREVASDDDSDALEIEGHSLWTTAETGKELHFLQNKTSSILAKEITALKLEYQKILFLYYGFGINQKQLADTLGINQSTISRYLTKSTVNLLDSLAEISQPQGWVKHYISQWLKQNYQTPQHTDLIQAVLVTAIKKLTFEQKEILQLCYGQKMNEIDITQKLGISFIEKKAILAMIQSELKDKLIHEINIWIKDYVDKWLSKYYKSLKKSVYPSGQQLTIAEQVAVVESFLQKQPVSIN